MALFAALTGDRAYVRPIVVLALGTAMRRENILRLKWRNVDFSRGCIYVTKTKTDIDYSVPMNETVRETLQALRFASKSEYVLTNPGTEKPWTDIKRAFGSACKEAGIKDLWFHDLRRTAATRMADAGVPLSVVQGILGHSDIRTTMRYVQVVDDDKRQAVSTPVKGGEKIGVSKYRPNEKRAAG